MKPLPPPPPLSPPPPGAPVAGAPSVGLAAQMANANTWSFGASALPSPPGGLLHIQALDQGFPTAPPIAQAGDPGGNGEGRQQRAREAAGEAAKLWAEGDEGSGALFLKYSNPMDMQNREGKPQRRIPRQH